MKNALLIVAIPITLLASPMPVSPAKVKDTPINHFATSFSFFRAHETGHGYNLQWKINGNSGVRSFIVECTYEDPSDQYSVWQVKGMVGITPGVNMFTDNNLLPGILNYRITAISNDNSPVAVSDILTVTVH